MLYLNRKVGESIIINNNVELTVVEVKGNSAKLGFVFPSHVSVLRKELHERLLEENIAAASGNDDALSAFMDMDALPEGSLDELLNDYGPPEETDPDADAEKKG